MAMFFIVRPPSANIVHARLDSARFAGSAQSPRRVPPTRPPPPLLPSSPPDLPISHERPANPLLQQKKLTKTLPLHPSYFTPALPAYLEKLLHESVEGTCSGKLGYIIAVIKILDSGRGKVVEGGAEFKITYTAIVYRPFRGEVVDGVVGSVNKVSARV